MLRVWPGSREAFTRVCLVSLKIQGQETTGQTPSPGKGDRTHLGCSLSAPRAWLRLLSLVLLLVVSIVAIAVERQAGEGGGTLLPERDEEKSSVSKEKFSATRPTFLAFYCNPKILQVMHLEGGFLLPSLSLPTRAQPAVGLAQGLHARSYCTCTCKAPRVRSMQQGPQ